MLVERVEVLVERVEVDVLSRFTVVVRPVLSVVFTVVRVVPLLLTRVSTDVFGFVFVVLVVLVVPVVVLGLVVLPLVVVVVVDGLAVVVVVVLLGLLFSTSERNCAAFCTLRPALEAGFVTR